MIVGDWLCARQGDTRGEGLTAAWLASDGSALRAEVRVRGEGVREEDDDDMVLVPIAEERREGGAKAIWKRRGDPGVCGLAPG